MKKSASTSTLLKTNIHLNENTQEFGFVPDFTNKEEKQKEISAYLKRISKLSRDYEKHYQKKPVFKYLQDYKQKKQDMIEESNVERGS